MKTTKDERAEKRSLLLNAVGTGVISGDEEWLLHLIADVNDAVKLLEQQHEHLAPNKKLPHSLCLICEFLFLKEPKS